jgi:hypothetical protein
MKLRTRSCGRRLLCAFVLAAAMVTTIPASAFPGVMVEGLVRRQGTVISIVQSTARTALGRVSLNGQRLTVECIKAAHWQWAGITYSLLTPVWAEYDALVIIRGRLPDGHKRWIGIGSFDGALIDMSVRSWASYGPCGFDVNIYDASPALGYLLVE